MTFKAFLKRSFCDDQGRIVLAQSPNLSGAITVGLIILGWIFSGGLLHTLLRSAAGIIGMYWAYLEIRYGVNYFRKVLGAAVAVMIISEVVRNILG